MWNENGSLSIIDRIKNLVKGPCGEYIALEKLESIYKNSSFVQNACVYASKDVPKIIAIIEPPPDLLKERHISKPSQDKELAEEILADLRKVGSNNGLEKYELPTHVLVSDEEWTPDNNMLTAAMKLNRRTVYDKNEGAIDSIVGSQ